MAKKFSKNISVNGVFFYLVLVGLVKAQEAQEDICGSCEATNGRFACMDETTYSFCYNSNQPDVTSTRHCPDGFYCNVNSMSVCSSTSTSSPSCIPTTPTPPTPPTSPTTPTTSTTQPTTSTTTAPEPFDPVIFCNNIQSTGNFKLASDATCKRYIYCYRLSGQLLGVQFICEDYYNSSTRKCQKTLPDDC